jgi:hypothetical protein
MTEKQAQATANILNRKGKQVYAYREGKTWLLAEGTATQCSGHQDLLFRAYRY